MTSLSKLMSHPSSPSSGIRFLEDTADGNTGYDGLMWSGRGRWTVIADVRYNREKGISLKYTKVYITNTYNAIT
jgi:hypothetical protein